MKIKPYVGPLNLEDMHKWARRAYFSWGKQRQRSALRGWVVGYTSREFIAWWLHEMRSKPKWKCPTISRIDHAKGYYFGNVKLEEKFDNICERNERCGNPGKMHRAVVAFAVPSGVKLRVFASKRDAAKFYGLSEKTVYNHCHGRTRQFFKFGPQTRKRAVAFKWK